MAATQVGGRVAGAAWKDLDVVEVPILAMKGEALVAPCGENDLDGLAESGSRLVEGHAEGLELRALEPGRPPSSPAHR